MKNIIIYPGSFDPFHKGHLEVVRACRRLFPAEEIWVAPEPSPRGKRRLKPLKTRLDITRASTKGINNCIVLELKTNDQGQFDFMTSLPGGVNASIIVGADKYEAIARGKGVKAARDRGLKFIVAARAALDIAIESQDFLLEVDSPVSSRQVKEQVANSGDVSALVAPEALGLILSYYN